MLQPMYLSANDPECRQICLRQSIKPNLPVRQPFLDCHDLAHPIPLRDRDEVG